MIKSFDHTTITVSKMKRSVEFYRDLLGFEVLGMLPQKKANFVYLQLGDYKLELFEFEENGSSYEPEPDEDVGLKHLAFRVEDVDAVTEKLKAEGVNFTLEPLETDGVKLAFFQDPDGISIEIIEGEPDFVPYRE